MNVLDLFCGAAGGWSLGLHRAGLRTVAACEWDEWRRERFAANFPGCRMYGDVRELTAATIAADGVGTIDVVAGSPPCQDASTANTSGKGTGGARTGLVSEFVRLVREVRPRWALFENVPGIRARGIDWVLAALAAAGYPSWPLVVGAWHAGAPHKRNRVWLIAADATRVRCGSWGSWGLEARDEREGLASPAREDADASPLLWPEIEGSESNGADALDATNSDSDGIREQSGRRCGQDWHGEAVIETDASDADESDAAGWYAPGRRERWEKALARWESWNGGFTGFGRMDDGLPKGMARQLLAAYGDAVVPIIPELIGRAIMNLERRCSSGDVER